MQAPLTPTYLLATDLDGTVIPFELTEERERELGAFARFVSERDDLVLAYVTGRHLALALEGVRRSRLPDADALACDVGTSVYRLSPDGGYVEDESYAAAMQGAFGNHRGRDILAALAGVEHLRPQEEQKQGPYKVSFYVEVSADHVAVLEKIRQRLSEIEANNNLIHSVDPVTGSGLVDVLPAGVSKATAVAHLQEALGLPAEAVLYAGDSGNDVEALVSGVNAVVVGNAADTVREEARRRAAAGGDPTRVYFAEQPYAAGVMEGCRHFGMS